MESKRDMDARAALIAVAVGVGASLVTFLVAHFSTRNDRNRLRKEVMTLKSDIFSMKEEISLFKEKAQKCETDGKEVKRLSRRQQFLRKRIDSETTMYTAPDSDEEFFDLSSEEDELSIAVPEEDNIQTFFTKIDKMMKSGEKTLEILLSRAEAMGNDPNFLWRLAKAYKLEFDANEEDPDKQLLLLNIGITHVQKATRLDSKNGDAHKWLAILTGLKTDFLPFNEKVRNGVEFYEHLNRAVNLKDNDHSLYYLLGRFKFTIASLSWYEKKAANMMGKLPNVTIEDAIRDCYLCESLSNTEPLAENRLLLAKAYFAVDNKQSGINWLRKTKEIAKREEAVFKEAAQLLVKYN